MSCRLAEAEGPLGAEETVEYERRTLISLFPDSWAPAIDVIPSDPNVDLPMVNYSSYAVKGQ